MKILRTLLIVCCGTLVFVTGAASLSAQDNGGGTGNGNGGGNGSNRSSGTTVVSPVTKSYTFEGIVMIALMAAATFAVCKSSTRGN